MYGDISVDVLNSSINMHLGFLTGIINNSFRDQDEFANILKYAEVFSVY